MGKNLKGIKLLLHGDLIMDNNIVCTTCKVILKLSSLEITYWVISSVNSKRLEVSSFFSKR